MSVAASDRPQPPRRTSRLPGGFETEDDMASDPEDFQTGEGVDYEPTASSYNSADDSSLLHSSENMNTFAQNNTMLVEREMNHQLMDVESSFLPEISMIPTGDEKGHDPFESRTPNDPLFEASNPTPEQGSDTQDSPISDVSGDDKSSVPSAPEASDAYNLPAVPQHGAAHVQEEDMTNPGAPNTSALENMSSSPTAAAAARTVSRVISQTTLGGYETANEDESEETPSRNRHASVEDDMDATPRKSDLGDSGHRSRGFMDSNNTSAEDLGQTPSQRSKRPQYLKHRQSSQRLSHSSLASSNTETASDATLGADYALQSGGSRPEPRLHRKPNMALSRSTSLGSIASGLSALSEGEDSKSRRAAGAPDLSTLNEESPLISRQRSRGGGFLTPKSSMRNLAVPTDTIIANNVRDIEVPGTFARQYRQNHGDISPGKPIPGMTPGPSRNSKSLTLKEHRSTVERLGKENFDLKMKIHFLDQALQRRSDDGVKDMITENVQLKSDKLRLERETLSLKKKVRDLEKKVQEGESPTVDQGYGTDEERSPTAEEEVVYLRDRMESLEVEIEKVRSESIAKEGDKRRLAEMVRSLGDTRAASSDVGSREERDMWKDMLEAETAAREQSEEDNKKLKDEIVKLRSRPAPSKSNRLPGLAPQSSGSDFDQSNSRDKSGPNLVELERLQHENSELQKTISAQVSTLTSRNKEKERLYQEIEDLKLGRMGVNGVRSVAGDSIFERSASRARSNSRASNATRISRVSDAERDAFEQKIGSLRDQVSELRLQNQNITSQYDELCVEFDAMDAQGQADIDQFTEDVNVLTMQRDEAVRDAADKEDAFQSLRAEAQEEIDGLGDELDQKTEEVHRLEEERHGLIEEGDALKNELRSAGERMGHLEEDGQSNLTRYMKIKSELDGANREIENLEKELDEGNAKIQRLTVQQESSHNEIAFLREEQDADKIKIGDMESVLKATHMSLSSEKDRTKGLDLRLSEQRRVQETMSSKEQEVQRAVVELNRDLGNSKEEVRRLKKTLSTREIESATWRERLVEFENNLREILGEANSTRSSLLTSVTKLQKELDTTHGELDIVRQRFDEKETLLANRDSLLEHSGLEYRKLADLLDRERQAHRADKHSFENALKSHSTSAKTILQTNSRIADLENGRQADRRRMSQLDQQYKDQLSERNSVLLVIWKRLSSMCGPDWAHSNSLINGNLPSQEVIGNMLFWPGFSRNLLLAAKQVEGNLVSFQDRIKRTERDMWKEYQGLEHTLDLRVKKLERIEEQFNNLKASQVTNVATSRSSRSPDLHKLKGENRVLKAELALLHQQLPQQQNLQHNRRESRNSLTTDGTSTLIPTRGSSSRNAGAAGTTAAMTATLMRHHSTNVVEHLSGANGSDGSNRRSNSTTSRSSNNRAELVIPGYQAPEESTSTSSADQQKWIHRLRELERRLKAEREARLLDRNGARKRLEERDAENVELKMELEREKLRYSLEEEGNYMGQG